MMMAAQGQLVSRNVGGPCGGQVPVAFPAQPACIRRRSSQLTRNGGRVGWIEPFGSVPRMITTCSRLYCVASTAVSTALEESASGDSDERALKPADSGTEAAITPTGEMTPQTDGINPNTEAEQPVQGHGLSRATIIWRALKLPLYTVALIPLMVGAGLARYHYGVLHASRFFAFLLHSVLVLAWLNLSNDAFDAETGVDRNKPESVVNLTGSRTAVLVGSFTLLAVGLAGLATSAAAVGDPRVFPLLAAAIACGVVYQCPPFRLSYKGLGEPLCFVAFGPLATSAFFLFQASSPGFLAPLTPAVLACSALVGLTTALILLCSHFHQIDGDRSVGKLSPIVRLGTARSAQLVVALVALLSAMPPAFVAAGILPAACLIPPLLALPVSWMVANFVTSHHDNKELIFMAKYLCTRLHVVFGVALSFCIALSKPILG